MSILRSIFRSLAPWLAKRHIYIVRSLALREKDQLVSPNFDYIRFATLGLLIEEINKNDVPGAVAELGVYQGAFAKHLNEQFPERKLYLFDTFDGFVSTESKNDQEAKYSDGQQDFSNTSVDLVLKRMPFPDQCIVRKGHFPKSANNVSDQFCFVSIDTDLYEPIKAGLTYFYPKLHRGGYILVHDFNNDEYKGVRAAVEEFCSANNIVYTPIPDGCGSVVIGK